MKGKAGILLSIVLVLTMVLSAGCRREDESANRPGTEAAQTSAPEKEREEKVTFTMFYSSPADDWEKSDVYKWIEQNLNVSLDIEYVVGDLPTRVGVMVASREFPDLVFGSDEHEKFIDAGALVPLNDYIDKQGVNSKKLYGNYLQRIKWTDGNIYHFPWDRGQQTLATETSGFYIQRAVLKEFGYPKIETVEEYIDLIARYKEKHPQINGKDTVGIELLTDDWRDFTLQNSPLAIMGGPNDGNLLVNQQTYEAKIFATMPESKKYYGLLNQAYLNGLIAEESFVNTYDQHIANLTAGNVLGVCYDHNWQIGQAQHTLKDAGMHERVYVAFPVVLEKGTKDQYQWPANMITRDGVGISVNCKNPERAFKFLDDLQSEEVQKILNWGIKGLSYEVDDNGRMYMTDDMREKYRGEDFRRKVGITGIRPWPSAPNYWKYEDGNSWNISAQPEEIRAGYDEWDLEILKAYDAEVYADMFAKPQESKYSVAWDIPIPSDHQAAINNEKLREVQRYHLPRLITAPEDKYDEYWNEYVKEVDGIGMDIYEEFVTEGIRQRVKDWWGE